MEVCLDEESAHSRMFHLTILAPAMNVVQTMGGLGLS
jgi:hypothetical protein